MFKKLSNLLRARFPYIYITSYEEERATSIIRQLVKNVDYIKYPRELYIWTQTNGFVCDDTEKVVPNTKNPISALEFVEKHNKDAVFVFYDIHVNFGVKNRLPDYDLVRKLSDLVADLKTGEVRKNVIFISPELVIPDTMQKDITILDFPLPTLPDIKAKLDSMLQQNSKVHTESLTESDKV